MCDSDAGDHSLIEAVALNPQCTHANNCSRGKNMYEKEHLGTQIAIFVHNLLEDIRVKLNMKSYPLELTEKIKRGKEFDKEYFLFA